MRDHCGCAAAIFFREGGAVKIERLKEQPVVLVRWYDYTKFKGAVPIAGKCQVISLRTR